MRAHNFNAGPAAMPLSVIEEIKADLPDWKGTGMSVLEVSHRSKEYAALHAETKALLTEVMAIPDTHEVLFVGGGATTQFAMLPLNLLAAGGVGAYVLTGTWASKAYEECEKVGKKAKVAATGEPDNYTRLPRDFDLDGTEAYVHLTSNNTIRGTQYRDFPAVSVPLVCDMSSDIMSHPIDVSSFDLLYAGAQKNMGPAGVTLVVGKKDVLSANPDLVPTYLRYKTHSSKDSLYNTPPVFAIYAVNKVLHWVKSNGGLAGMAARNQAKAELLYNAAEASGGFLTPTVPAAEDRSWMNATFRLPTEELEAAFIEAAKAENMIGLKGHRSVGGIRASIYNATSLESVTALVDFLKTFQAKHG